MGKRGGYIAGLSYGMVSFFVAAILGIVTGIIVARVYGINVVGEYALVLAPVGAMWFLSTVREQSALIMKLAVLPPRDPRIGGLFWPVFGFSFLLTTLIAAIVFAVTVVVYRGPIDQPDLIAPAGVLLAGYLVFENTNWNIDAVLGAFRAGPALLVGRMADQLGYLAMSVVAATFTTTVWGITIATVVAFAAALVIRTPYLFGFLGFGTRWSDLRQGLRELPGMIHFGLRMFPGQFFEGLTNQSSIWVVGVFAPISSVGAFSRAWQLSSRLRDATYRVAEILFPTLVETRAKKQWSQFNESLVDAIRYIWLLLLAPAAAAGGAAVGVMDLYGPGFDVAALALAIMLLMPPLYATSVLIGLVLDAHERPLKGSAPAVIQAVIAVPLTVGLVVWFGITGAAIAMVAGYAIATAAAAWLASHHIEGSIARLWGVKPVAAQLVAYGLGLVAARAVDMVVPGVLGVAVAIAAGLLTYTAVFLLTGGLLERDRERARTVADKLGLSRTWIRIGTAVPTSGSLGQRFFLGVALVGMAAVAGAASALNPLLGIALVAGVILVALLAADLLTGLLAFTVFQFMTALPAASGQSLTVVKAAGVILALAWLANLTVGSGSSWLRRLLSEHTLAMIGIGTFLVIGGLSFVWALDSDAALGDFQRYLLNAVLLVITFSAIRTVGAGRKLAGALALGGGLAVLGGLVLASGQPGRLAGTVGEANTLAALVVPGIILSVILLMTTPSRVWRNLLIAVAIVGIAGVVLTLSRGGLISLAVATLVLIAFGGRWRKRMIWPAVGTAVLALAVFFVVTPAAERERVFSSENGSSGRTDIWSVGSRAIEDAPFFGSGLGNFTVVTPRNLLEPGTITRSDNIVDDPQVAHNVLLETTVETGLVGAFGFALLLVAAIVSAGLAARRFQRSGNVGGEALSRGVVASLAGLYVSGMFISLQFEKPLWILLGLSLALLSMARDESPVADPFLIDRTRGSPAARDPVPIPA